MSTERLYYTDPYLTRFTARVVDVAEDGRRVYLDRSAFYPTSGGQPHDTGRLGGTPVTDVVDEGERIAHHLAGPLAALDVELTGEVDWARRFDLMQQHTAQHLLSAVFADRFGWPTVSVHFGDTSSTLDLETGVLDAEAVRRAELEANAIITEDRPVTVGFEEAATATGLRKASERPGLLRIVTITGLDRSACGGTHVRRTGEIGALLLRKVERTRKQVRVEFLAGPRAIRRARLDQELLGSLAAGFSAPPDDLPALVDALRREAKEGASARRGLAERLAEYRVRELYAATPADGEGVRRMNLHAGPGDDLRALGQAALALPRCTFLGTSDAPPTLLLAASADSGVDAGATLKAALGEAGGRGGGSPRLAQGTVPEPAALRVVRARLGG